jgi:hypothetical protein
MPTMVQKPDIAVFDAVGQTVLVAEVKAKPQSSPEWAALLRRNLVAYGLPQAPYFMVATPEQLYLWAGKQLPAEPIPPDISVGTRELFEPYLSKAQVAVSSLSEGGLELIVAAWLNELVGGYEDNRLPPSAAEWFKSEGLLDALRGGRLVQN